MQQCNATKKNLNSKSAPTLLEIMKKYALLNEISTNHIKECAEKIKEALKTKKESEVAEAVL